MNCYLYINEKNISGNHSSAIEEFIKRLSPYCKVVLMTNRKRFNPDTVNKSDHAVFIIKKGRSTCSSTELSKQINTMQINGISKLHVLVGYEDTIENATPFCISAADLSNKTTALLFLEQLYRAYTIIQGKTYHK